MERLHRGVVTGLTQWCSGSKLNINRKNLQELNIIIMGLINRTQTQTQVKEAHIQKQYWVVKVEKYL